MWRVEGSLGGGESELENAAVSMRCVVERNRELFSGEWILPCNSVWRGSGTSEG